MLQSVQLLELPTQLTHGEVQAIHVALPLVTTR